MKTLFSWIQNMWKQFLFLNSEHFFFFTFDIFFHINKYREQKAFFKEISKIIYENYLLKLTAAFIVLIIWIVYAHSSITFLLHLCSIYIIKLFYWFINLVLTLIYNISRTEYLNNLCFFSFKPFKLLS